MAKDRGKLDATLAAMFSNPDYRGSYLFYAHMISQCSIRIRHDISAPAGISFIIDHYDLYINPDRFDIFPLKERLFILQHEMHHILNNHVGRTGNRIHKPWNWATDCAINQLGNQDHTPRKWIDPESGKEMTSIYPETLGKMLGVAVPVNKSAEYYYDMIKDKVDEEKKKQKGEGGSGQPGEKGQPGDGMPGFGDADGDPQPLDDHETWQESTGDKELQADLTKKMIERSQTESLKGRGDVPAGFSGWLEIHTRKSEMNWKKILRGITGNKRVGTRPTIMRNDRRFPHRADLRGKTKERLFNLLVIGDVSGSMGDEALLYGFGQIKHICDITQTDVDLIQVDARAYPPEKLGKKTKLIERKGHGGTYLYPAIEMAKKHKIDFQAVVVLTDGGVSTQDVYNFEKLNMKVIWLVEENGFILPEMSAGRMIACKLKGAGDE